jgi:predicted enzyme related to lactoylglutathione lyase
LKTVPTPDLVALRDTSKMSSPLLGLRTVIYPAPDLKNAKEWWSNFLGFEPYFDEPFYVGFNVEGYEPGLLPDANQADEAQTYWGVLDVEQAAEWAITQGARVVSPATQVGDGIVTATVRTPSGSVVGFIFNPHFTLS